MSTFDEARKSADPHWRAGDAERAKRFAAATDFVVYTPGKSAGRPLTLEPIPDLTPLREDADELESAVAMVHGALASVVASGRSQRAQSKLGILTNTLTFFAKHVSKTSLPALIELLNELPEQALLGIANERKLAREMADALRIELVGNPLLKGSGTPRSCLVMTNRTAALAFPPSAWSVFHRIWWAITTLTTVGYGDVYPITTGGRMFTFLVLFAGLGIVSVPAGLVSAALLRARSMEADEKSGNELPK